MPTSATDNNVLNFPGTASTSPPRGRVLNECREFALHRLQDSLRGMLQDIEKELMGLADAELDCEQRSVYLDACGMARNNWDAIGNTFLNHVQRYFDARVNGDARGAPLADIASSLEELRLVGEDDLTEDIAQSEITKKLRERCEDELFGVERRLCSLLGKTEAADEDNPLSPEVMASALAAACKKVDMSVKLRLVLLQALEQKISAELSTMYRDLNQRLVHLNILPHLKRAYRRQKSPNGNAKRGAGPSAEEKAVQKAAEIAAEQDGADMYTLLRQLLQGHAAMTASQATSDLGAGLFNGSVPSIPSSAIPIALESLSALQQQSSLQGLSGAASVNMLRDFRASEIGRELGQLDAITVDIVAMLFDFILDDEQIADPVKALVGRMQIPVLKVALLDKGFFSSRAHPVRRLLDRISAAAVRWGPDVKHDDPLYSKLSHIVERVLSEFDQDVELFEDLTRELDDLLANLDQEQAKHEARSARWQAERERAEQLETEAKNAADSAISKRLAEALPDAVRYLLTIHWREILRREYRFGGNGQTSDFEKLLKLADVLVWSVQPKFTIGERAKLRSTIPRLIPKLNKALDTLGLPKDERQFVLDALFDIHASMLRSGLPQSAGSKQWRPRKEASANDEATTPEVTTECSSEDGLEVETIKVDLPKGYLAPTVERIALLRRGDWVEYVHADGTHVRHRLSWVSPQRSIYLFTNPESPRAISASPEALAVQVERGELRLIGDEPIFERAVNRALEALAEAA